MTEEFSEQVAERSSWGAMDLALASPAMTVALAALAFIALAFLYAVIWSLLVVSKKPLPPMETDEERRRYEALANSGPWPYSAR